MKMYNINIKENYTIDKSGLYNLTITNKETTVIVSKDLEVNITTIFKYDNSSINFIVDENTTLNYYETDNNSDKKIKFDIKEKSFLTCFSFRLNKEENSETEINLIGENSKAEYNLSIFSNNDKKGNYNIRINHLNKNTTSNIFNIGILGKKSKCYLDVTSFIKKSCSKSSAYQKSKLITLDETTDAMINPNLLIDEYDVAGGHAACVSKISDEDIYYLNSRGISKKEAIKMLSIGLLLEKAPLDKLEELESIIEREFTDERL